MALRTLPESVEDLAQTTVGRTFRGKLPRSGLQALQAVKPRSLTTEGITVEQHIREGRFQRSLALIAGLSSILAGFEVLTQHIRGSYGQRIMFTPVLLSPLHVIAGVWAVFSRRAARTLLPALSALMLLDGVIGFFYHIRGVARRPGGWRIPQLNVVMGPPLFAPLLFGISGFLGLIATFLRREGDPASATPTPLSKPQRHVLLGLLPRRISSEGITLEQDIREGRFQKGLAIGAGLSALFNGLEALYSHYRDGYMYRVQWTPVLLAPIVMVVSFAAVASKKVAHTLLPVVSLLAIVDGLVGFYFHLRGLKRLPTFPKQLEHSLVYGPPSFAPLLFAATGFMGVLASLMRREK